MKTSLLSISRKLMATIVAIAFVVAPFPVQRAEAVAAPVCSPDAQTVVSDETTLTVSNESMAVAVTPHPAWVSIASSTWIWDSPLDETGSSPEGSVTFSKNFTIPVGSNPTDSSLEIAADNTYSVAVNGTPLDTGTSATDTDNFTAVDTWTIPAVLLAVGENNITIVVTNAPRPDGYTGPNPGGLIYKATINSETCVVPPPDVTVTVIKYIDGVPATAENADSTSFSMTATWRAANLNGGVESSAPFELDSDGFIYNDNPVPYHATTSEMTSGADYSAVENGVPSTCTSETPFALDGYRIGDTEQDAVNGTTTASSSITNITTNKYLLVMNTNCALVPPSLPVHLSLPDGTSTSTESATLLDWTDSTTIHPNVTYTYQAANDPATNPDGTFVTPIYTSGPLTDSQIPTAGTPEGVYYWHVKATDANGNSSAWTTPWQIIIDNTAPSLPVHLSLPDGSVYKSADATMLDWTDSTDISPVTYLYESALDNATNTDGSFVTPVYEVPAPLTDSQIPTGGTPEGKYYWHVKAVDAAGHESEWTTPWTITIDDTAPTLPFHISPPNNSFLTTATWTLADWSDATDTNPFPITYLYESANNPATTSLGAFSFPVYNSAPLSDSEIPTNGTPEGVWYWHVLAKDQAGNTSPWTDAWKVTINNSTSTDDDEEDATTTAPILTIVKNTTGGDGTFNFVITGDTSTSTQITTEEGSGSKDITLNEGTSTVSELQNFGWMLDDVDCEYDNESVGNPVIGGEEITVDNGDHVTCTFINRTSTSTVATTTGAIRIIKDVVGSDGQTDVEDDALFNVTLNGTSTQEVGEDFDAYYYDLTPGFYTIDEATSSDYDLVSISPDANSEANGAQVLVSVGTTTVVTIINKQHEATSTPETPAGPGGGGGDPFLNPNAPGGGGGGGPSSFSTNNTGGGSVLGAATDTSGPSCDSDKLLTQYMRLGRNNDSKEVTKLQNFLNTQNLGFTLPVTGFFGPLTDKVVKIFQVKFAQQILGPWYNIGLYPNLNVGTGYVYKTTLRWINLTICASLNTPVPQLP